MTDETQRQPPEEERPANDITLSEEEAEVVPLRQSPSKTQKSVKMADESDSDQPPPQISKSEKVDNFLSTQQKFHKPPAEEAPPEFHEDQKPEASNILVQESNEPAEDMPEQATPENPPVTPPKPQVEAEVPRASTPPREPEEVKQPPEPPKKPAPVVPPLTKLGTKKSPIIVKESPDAQQEEVLMQESIDITRNDHDEGRNGPFSGTSFSKKPQSKAIKPSPRQTQGHQHSPFHKPHHPPPEKSMSRVIRETYRATLRPKEIEMIEQGSLSKRSNAADSMNHIQSLTEDQIKQQIDDMVKRQLTTNLFLQKQAFTPIQNGGQGDPQMNMTGMSGLLNPSVYEGDADSQFKKQRSRRLSAKPDILAKSQMSFRSQGTKKAGMGATAGSFKIVSGASLAPVGLEKKETVKAKNIDDMLDKTLETENLVEKVMKITQENTQNDLSDWPNDAFENPQLQESLSHTKMENEINHREPRIIDSSGQIARLPICGTSTGCYSTKKEWRKSDAEQLGLGINLYLKTLKFFMCLFFFLFLLSIPSLLIFFYGGDSYSEHRVEIQKWVGSTTLGNLGSPMSIVSSAAMVPPTRNMATYMAIGCEDEQQVMTDLMHFGMAFKDYTVTGFGMNTTVQTIDKCSYGLMKDERTDAALDYVFNKECAGRKHCSFYLDLEKAFDLDCQYEMRKRLNGFTFYGPPKVYMLALCSQDKIDVNGFWEIGWSRASMVIVWIDVLIAFVFVLAMFRLKYYQELVLHDFKDGKFSIDDFTILVKSIPIGVDDYDNNPELLTAMIATHFEDILRNEVQVIPEMEDVQEFQDQIVSINYGMSSQKVMGHLLQIYEHVEEIGKIKQKMQNDLLRAPEYEKEMWQRYTQITQIKDAYYAEKKTSKPKILTAYVTFRSMEGKMRAEQAYQPPFGSRFFSEYCCCMPNIFTKKKLLGRGFYTVTDPGDPKNIVWENLGVSFIFKAFRYTAAFLVACVLFVGAFWALWWIARYEKNLKNYVRRDCTELDAPFSQQQAFADFMAPEYERMGLLHCYCQQVAEAEGTDALETHLFSNGEALCSEWNKWYGFEEWSSYLIAIIIAIINLILQIFFNWLVKAVGRPKNSTNGLRCRMVTIFGAQFVNSVIVLSMTFHSFLIVKTRLETNIVGSYLVGPFYEFNERWYLVMGTPIILTILLQVFTPHLDIIFGFLVSFCRRCHDRGFGFDPRHTRQVIQSEYEDLYTGPDFILQVRLAQMQSVVFVSMTFSSGMPILYLIGIVSFFLAYWIDKILLLRYFKLTTSYTKYVNQTSVHLLPLAAIVHYLFGFIIFSYPHFLNTEINHSVFGESNEVTLQSQYFNAKRQGQHHMLVYFFTFIALLALLLFQKPLTAMLSHTYRSIASSCLKYWRRFRNMPETEYQEAFLYSDDLFAELDFKQLFSEFVRVKKERQKYKLLKTKGSFTAPQLRKYVDRYIQILLRNEKAIFRRIYTLTDEHIERIEGVEPDMMTPEEQIKTVLEYYKQAIDKNNPLRDNCVVEDSMHGRLQGAIHSFDFMDNPKYQRLGQLLEIMQETFGYNDDIQGLIRNSITEADFLLGKTSVDLKRMINDGKTTGDMDSIKSDQPLNENSEDNSSGLRVHRRRSED